jgi:acyl-CoA synthetase (AMP-forming)/AMP-acid ligase II
VQALPACHEFNAAEKHVEAVGPALVARLRVGVEGTLSRRVALHGDELAAVGLGRPAADGPLMGRRGAALALASGNRADFLAVYYACAKLGVVCVPINLGWQPEEVAYVLGHSGARGIVVEPQLLTAMRDAIAKFVVTRPGETIDAAELIAALKTHLAGFKVPKAVVFVDQLPKTSTGKIQKNVVRSEYAAHYATSEG